MKARNGEIVATDGGQGFSARSDARSTLNKLMRGDYDGPIEADDDNGIASSTDAGWPGEQDRMRLDVEAFVHAWGEVSPGLKLDPGSRLIGDALAIMASQLVKAEDPPKGVLREAFNWFAQKTNAFADEFARAAGKTTGAAAGVGIGVSVTGHLPRLVTLIDRVLQHLG